MTQASSHLRRYVNDRQRLKGAFFHLLLALSFVLGLLLLSGCNWTKAEEKPPKIGAEVASEVVQKAIGAALEGISPETLRAGDAALYETNYRVETSAPIIASNFETYVTRRLNCAEKTRLVMKEIETHYKAEGQEVKTNDRVMDIAKIDLAPIAPLFTESQAFVTLSQALQSGGMELLKPLKVESFNQTRQTLHNLNVTEYQMTPPQQSPDCARFPDCKINVTEIRVDIVNWLHEKKPKKVEILWKLSKDTPWMASTLLMCQNQILETEDRSYFVNQCQVLRDFILGADVAPEEPDTLAECH